MGDLAEIWQSRLDESTSLAAGEKVFFAEFTRMAMGAGSILEVGVGKGRIVKSLRDIGVKGEITGVDLFKHVHDPDLEFALGDARFLPFKDASFDFVYSFGVVEHFRESETAVREHVRVTRQGGIVFVTTPRISLLTLVRFTRYLRKERELGTFEQVRGRNLFLHKVERWARRAGLDIIFSGVAGGIWKNKERLLTPGYLYCAGIKR